jgi:spore germination cell wall hydrolase CwlJ-like protein
MANCEVPRFDNKGFKCLVDNAYYEARGEGIEGMMAVTYVVLNRAKRTNKHVCSVIKAKGQFSWKSLKLKKAKRLDALRAAQVAVLRTQAQTENWEEYPGDAEGEKWKDQTKIQSAYYFHSKSVLPSWAQKKVLVAVIGNHLFYKE